MKLTGAIPKQSNSTVQIQPPPWLNLRRKPELDLLPLELDFLYGLSHRPRPLPRPPGRSFAHWIYGRWIDKRYIDGAERAKRTRAERALVERSAVGRGARRGGERASEGH